MTRVRKQSSAAERHLPARLALAAHAAGDGQLEEFTAPTETVRTGKP